MRLVLLLVIRRPVPSDIITSCNAEEEAPEEEAAEVAVSLEFCIWYTWNLRFSQVHL